LDRLHPRVLRCERVSIWPWWTRDHPGDPFWRWYLHDRAGAAITVRDRRFAIPAGRPVLVPPWTPFICSPAPAVVQTYVHFLLEGLPRSVTMACFPEPAMPAPDGALRALLAGIAAQGERDPLAAQCRLAAAVLCTVGILVGQVPPGRAGQIRSALDPSPPVTAALAFLRENRTRTCSAAEVAAAAGVGLPRLRQLIREHTGQTLRQAAGEDRLQAALERLLGSDQRIDDIAREFGFGTRFYFTRRFTRRFGMGPGAYRRRILTDFSVMGE
jgi:AraC-like DNA-binding protein